MFPYCSLLASHLSASDTRKADASIIALFTIQFMLCSVPVASFAVTFFPLASSLTGDPLFVRFGLAVIISQVLCLGGKGHRL